MTRDLRRLADSRFDLVIVGAGVYGAMAAWDATLRGLAVALIDQGDFGSGTSANNHKTLHGGLRSLQSLNLRQMRLFIRERRALARVAPHLVRPLPFIVPTYAHPLRAKGTMWAALMMNDAIAADRHDGVDDPALQLPQGRVVSRDECLRLNPLIDPSGVTGGAIWHDYQMHNTDRMTFAFVASAAGRGAVVANYLQATSVLRSSGAVDGVTVRDVLGGDTLDIRAPSVLNATGAWAAPFLDRIGPRLTSPAPRLSRAMNLVVRRLPTVHACGGRARGRFVFAVPWRDVSIVGTSHDPHPGSAEDLAVRARDIEPFLDEAREAFPNAELSASDVRLVHRGLLPMTSTDAAGHVQLLKESTVVDHTLDSVPGLVSMFGVRYTTARATAEQAIDLVFRQRGVERPPICTTATTAIAGGDIGSQAELTAAAVDSHAPGMSRDGLTRLALTYGTEHRRVLDLMRAAPHLAQPLGEHCDVTRAEVIHAVRHECAVRLSDALLRRTEAGTAGHPGDDAVHATAEVMARELGWSASRVQDERDLLRSVYDLDRPPSTTKPSTAVRRDERWQCG